MTNARLSKSERPFVDAEILPKCPFEALYELADAIRGGELGQRSRFMIGGEPTVQGPVLPDFRVFH